jgi:branched-chain amino acid transport system ATP-binding protein
LSKLRRPLNVIHGNDRFTKFNKARGNSTLSGGEQQMLAIGRALMSRPRLIMFDEPSLGLAPNIVERTFAIIRGIRDAGTTVLLVEQNAFAALEMCDHAYLLEGGRIVLSGPSAEMIENEHVRKAYLGG